MKAESTRETYVRTTTEPYRVTGWGGARDVWWVEARNGRTVATCTSERMARRIARLLNEDAWRRT